MSIQPGDLVRFRNSSIKASNASGLGGNYAVLLHGIQPKGSKAAKAMCVLRRNKVKFSYNRTGV